MDRPVRELNLELGRPDAAEALRRLAAEVEAARKMGTPAMKLVHGYGSSGKGGRLRTACRSWLRQDRDLDAENRGVTFVLLEKRKKGGKF